MSAAVPSVSPATPDPARHTAMANAIRALSMDAVQQAKSGHPGMPMGMADVATVLFTRFLNYDPTAPDWPDRDRFVLSAGHGSMLLYSLLYLTGYPEITVDEIRNFRQLGSRTAGHPEYGHAAGIETTTGPLGQGLANGVGMALAERMLNARYGDDLVDHFTYVIAGDGCLMEGISHEAISLAGHLRLGRLIVLFDDNKISIDGPTDLTVSDDQLARFAASGWEVGAVDGHDAEAVAAAIEGARQGDRPSLIACRTTIAYGAPTKAGTSASHGAPLGDDEIAGVRQALDWPHPPFVVPDDILGWWREAGARGGAARAVWAARLAVSDRRDDFERAQAGDLPADWRDRLDAFTAEMVAAAPKQATRQSSGAVLDVLTAAIPELVGGSADLTGSNNTKATGQAVVAAGAYDGGYIYYGVREHAMAAAMNGMALHRGLIPYGGTFLIFTDYCRPAIRLSALMGLRVVYVMTHDSIGLGEDGPTHQPVEHLAALRVIPNLNVYRPADVVETAECWTLALGSATTPSVLALTRQGVPTLRTGDAGENLSARGAYVLREAVGEARVTLFATGSEIELAVAARDQLQADDIGTRVVSVPCFELFEAQDDAYRADILGAGTVRVAVEAAAKQGWERFIGEDGAFVGMTGFGASAPANELYAHFGITAEAVADAARARL
jgi:transketolase